MIVALLAIYEGLHSEQSIANNQLTIFAMVHLLASTAYLHNTRWRKKCFPSLTHCSYKIKR